MSEKTDRFINVLGPLAQLEMERRHNNGENNTLASVCIAQAACETGWGASGIMTNANAYFGIKATKSWVDAGGKIYNSATQECYDGSYYTNINACFRAYDSLEDSVKDYFRLICDSGIYSNDTSSPTACIEAIQETPYATSPTYISTITSIVEDYNLAEWDHISEYNNPVMTRSEAEDYVGCCYMEYLNRMPDPEGLHNYVEGLLSGNYSELFVEENIKDSEEYKVTYKREHIKKCYRVLLGREAGEDEINIWYDSTDLLRHIYAGVRHSPECIQRLTN